jgi:hypothetical protein
MNPQGSSTYNPKKGFVSRSTFPRLSRSMCMFEGEGESFVNNYDTSISLTHASNAKPYIIGFNNASSWRSLGTLPINSLM